MTPRSTTHRSSLSLAVTGVASVFAAGFIAVACGGSTFNSNHQGEGVTAGDPCSTDGDTATSVDGCNTCTCQNGQWSCTEKACASGGSSGDGGGTSTGGSSGSGGGTSSGGASAGGGTSTGGMSGTGGASTGGGTSTGGGVSVDGGVCVDGDMTSDGCNTCSCFGGQWACTARACPPACPAPTEPDGGVTCPAVVVYARDPETQVCCQYSDPCHAPSGWDQFNTLDECQAAVCSNGDSKPAADGCNTCSCNNGQWLCTLIACQVQVCGGLLGATCTDTEYCAYVEGDMCGAADATSTCQPRPQVCDQIYDPVCACDGNTYANACTANAAGSGVNYAGACHP